MRLFVANKVFLQNEEGHILFIREASTHPDGVNEGKWDVPGGRMDISESILDAAKREVKEEVGVEIGNMNPFAVDERHPVVRGEEWKIVLIYYIAQFPKGGEVRLSEEHDDFRFVDLAEVNKLDLISGLSNVIEQYKNRFPLEE